MHEYAQDIFRRLMGGGKKPKGWSEDSIRRFASLCYEKAPACECGCGNKTMVSHKKKGKPGMTISKWFSQWFTGSVSDIEFYSRLPGHSYPFEMSDETRQAILASIVGDGYMSLGNKKSKLPRITWNMGCKKHAEYKKVFFEDYGSTLTEKENGGWGNITYSVATKSCAAFVDIYKNYNLKNKAERARAVFNELTEVGWAWLYGDDGHLDSKNGIAYIHTEGLGEKGTEIASVALAKFLGSSKPISIHRYKGGTPIKQRACLKLKKGETYEFIKRISPYMASGMEYKKLKSGQR